MKAELLATLEQHAADQQTLLKQLRNYTPSQVQRADLRDAGQALAREWFDKVVPSLEKAGISSATIEPFSESFRSLLATARGRPRTKSYRDMLSKLVTSYREELIHAIEIRSFSPSAGLSIAPYVEGLPEDEGAYLDEAQRCLTVDAIRACIVLGWCATVSRLHEKVAALGFDAFNRASDEMAAKQTGRFKPFNKKFKVESVSELERMVFDTDLLWILEYMQLIDSNQHERLRHCFLMRNNSAHPGQAPITGENLYSFYSDVTQIVLKNPTFDLK